MKYAKKSNYCPGCNKIVGSYEPTHGGTDYDQRERPWHHDCYERTGGEDGVQGKRKSKGFTQEKESIDEEKDVESQREEVI